MRLPSLPDILRRSARQLAETTAAEGNASLITRRDALRKLSAGTLLGLGLWPGCLRLRAKTGEPGSFKFIAVNDTHYMSPECGQWLTHVVRQMKTEGAEFCLLSGDLTEHGRLDDLAAVRDIFGGLGLPTYVQIGNHDYVTQTDRTAYEDLFPRRINYGFEHRGWQFVGLDSTEGQRYQKTSIQPATFTWLDRHLSQLDPAKPTVLFTHFPLGEASLPSGECRRASGTLPALQYARHFWRSLSCLHLALEQWRFRRNRQMLRAQTQQSRWIAGQRLLRLRSPGWHRDLSLRAMPLASGIGRRGG